MATYRHWKSLTVITLASATLVVSGAQPAGASVRVANRAASLTAGISTPSSSSLLQAPTRRAASVRATTARARRVAARAAAAAPKTATTTTTPTTTTTTTKTPVTTTPTTTAPVTTTTVPVSTSPSGVAAPIGNLTGWKQTYVEDFTKPVATGSWPGTYGSHWYAYNDGLKDTSKHGTYMPSKVLSVHDGVLDYHVYTANGQHLVAAPVLKDTYGQTYGRYSVRFKADKLAGYKNAWLMWPDSERWPTDGEIDFPEGDLDGSIDAFSHFASSTGGQDAFSSSSTFQSWHTATIEWVPGKVSFILDGHVLGSSTKNVPATAMHWVLQTETALSGSAPADSVNGHVLVDWVALYTRA